MSGNFLPGYQGFMGKFRNYDISSLRFPLKEFSEINFIRSIIISLNEKVIQHNRRYLSDIDLYLSDKSERGRQTRPSDWLGAIRSQLKKIIMIMIIIIIISQKVKRLLNKLPCAVSNKPRSIILLKTWVLR